MPDNQLAALRKARVTTAAARDDLLAAEIAAGEREPLGRAWRWGPPVAALLALALAAVAVWWAVGFPRPTASGFGSSGFASPGFASSEFSDGDYVRAATTRVELLLSADPDDSDRAARILDGATGEFADEFAQSADAYSAYVARTGVRGTGRVEAAVLAQREGDAAVVLIVAELDVEGVAPQQLRLRTVVADEHGVLRLAGVELLP